MKFLLIILFCIFILREVNFILTLNDWIKDATGDVSERNISTMCTDDKCVMKCCPIGKVVKTKVVTKKDVNNKIRKKWAKFCVNYNQTKNLSDLIKENVFVDISYSTFDVKHGIFEAEDSNNFTTKSMNIAFIPGYNIYLSEHAELLLELPNFYDRWTHIPNTMFCWDYQMKKVNHTVKLTPGIWVSKQILSADSVDNPESKYYMKNIFNRITAVAGLVSCFFLFLVLVVYGLLPELRNLGGLILMSYVASLLGTLLLQPALELEQNDAKTCLGLTFSIYYLFMACFSWMNVMSYDIWLTFRDYAKVQPNHRRDERCKFLMYCMYAWGLPLTMTILLGILNSIDLKAWPWFVTPNITKTGCSIKGGEAVLYLYIPILILILCNWTFYIMTAFNVRRLSRGTAILDSAATGMPPQAHRTLRHRLSVYLKLSIVMGLTWVLDVFSYIYPESFALNILSIYNYFIGISIFVILVCKRKILRKLIDRFYRQQEFL